MRTSCRASSSGTCPISLRYIRTGSSELPPSPALASVQAPAHRFLDVVTDRSRRTRPLGQPARGRRVPRRAPPARAARASDGRAPMISGGTGDDSSSSMTMPSDLACRPDLREQFHVELDVLERVHELVEREMARDLAGLEQTPRTRRRRRRGAERCGAVLVIRSSPRRSRSATVATERSPLLACRVRRDVR